jgi:hypothetical protein
MHLLILAILVVIGQFALLYHYLRLVARKRTETQDVTPYVIVAFILMIAGPFMGFMMTYNTHEEHPFDSRTFLTPIAWTFLMNVFYWISLTAKRRLSPVMLAILPIGLLAGIIFMLLLTIHMGPYMLLGLVVPVMGLPAICPPLIAGLLMRELSNLSAYVRYEYELTEHQSGLPFYDALLRFFRQSFIAQSPILVFATFPLFLIVQGILVLLGQPVDSYIQTFTNGCGFTFSVQQHCYSNTGGHYLCSIAANGNGKLVKPLRYGYRRGGYMTVNRQLLIANAFEQSLEIHFPRLHRKIRNAYDACNIPVDEWCRNKKLANIIYVLMKPLEVLFLCWLYLVDKSPENRIARQYLPPRSSEK